MTISDNMRSTLLDSPVTESVDLFTKDSPAPTGDSSGVWARDIATGDASHLFNCDRRSVGLPPDERRAALRPLFGASGHELRQGTIAPGEPVRKMSTPPSGGLALVRTFGPQDIESRAEGIRAG